MTRMITSTTPVADAARSFGVDVETMMSIMSSLPADKKIELCDKCGDILFVEKDDVYPFYCGWGYCKHVDYDYYWTSDYDHDYYDILHTVECGCPVCVAEWKDFEAEQKESDLLAALADPYEGIDCGFRGKLPQWVPVP